MHELTEKLAKEIGQDRATWEKRDLIIKDYLSTKESEVRRELSEKHFNDCMKAKLSGFNEGKKEQIEIDARIASFYHDEHVCSSGLQVKILPSQ